MTALPAIHARSRSARGSRGVLAPNLLFVNSVRPKALGAASCGRFVAIELPPSYFSSSLPALSVDQTTQAAPCLRVRDEAD
jgi:hypothetical protein